MSVSQSNVMVMYQPKQSQFLQNSLLSSLVIETMRAKFEQKVPLYDHFGTAQKILQQFNISPVTLVNMKTAEERQKYLATQFQWKVDQLLSEWRLKIAQKDKRLEDLDRQLDLTRKRNKKQHKDMFQWLVLKTKFSTLQKKLKELLLDKLNEYENQLKIIDAFKEKKQIVLEGIPIVTIQELVQRADPQVRQRPSLQSTVFDDQEFEWNPLLERRFQKERARAVRAYSSKVRTANLNQVGFMQIFDQLKIEDPVFLQRDLKLAKYMEGDWLTIQEMKFLANTSELLNSCVDKNYIRKAVSQVDQHQLHGLETYLAEQIINNHRVMQNKIEQARQRWLNTQIQNTKKKIWETDKENEKQQTYKRNAKINEAKKRTLTRICKKLEKNITVKEQVYGNFFCQLFVRKVIQRVEYFRLLKQQEERKWKEPADYLMEEEAKRRKAHLLELARPKADKAERQRKYHPPSKLGYLEQRNFTAEDLQSIEGKSLFVRHNIMREKEMQFKLGVRVLKDQKENFAKFYSSGPQRGLRQEPLYDPSNVEQPQLSAKEMRSIIMIQKAIRRYLCKKKMRNYREIYYQRKFKLYQGKLLELAVQKKFQDTVQSVSQRLKTGKSRVKTECSLSAVRSLCLKTEETYEGATSIGASRQQRLLTGRSKELLTKHERLLRYSKINQANNIIKAGFYYQPEDMEVFDGDGNTPLYYAAMHGNNALIEFLLRNGANPNTLCREDTPLHMAVKSQKLDIVFMMLNYGGNMEVANRLNQTPLVFASERLLKFLGMQHATVTRK